MGGQRRTKNVPNVNQRRSSGGRTRYRIARRDPEAPPLRDRIDDLKRCTQSLARSANERALHR